MNLNKIRVSVFCAAYNHEKYIRKALEGFVMQKTNFAFEVLINDDASTDNTANIIREYEEKYPEIIKPVYQTENQYSQRIPIIKTHLLPKAKGEYFAWCEGDDYWTDPYKLQKQIDFLDKNPEYSICVHKVSVNNLKNNIIYPWPNIEEARDYSLEEIIIGGGSIFETCSLVMRRDVYTSKPSCFNAKGFGDYQWYMYGAICGKCRCLSDNMAVYNLFTAGSWSSRTTGNEKLLEYYKELKRMLENVNEYYEHKYSNLISVVLENTNFQIAYLSNDKEVLKSEKYIKKYKKQLFNERKNKYILKVKKLLPFLVKIKRFLLKQKTSIRIED